MVVVVTPLTVIETELTTVLADEDPPAALLADDELDDPVADDDEVVAEVDCDAVVEASELTELIDMAKPVCRRENDAGGGAWRLTRFFNVAAGRELA
jgi:hypothetical protein